MVLPKNHAKTEISHLSLRKLKLVQCSKIKALCTSRNIAVLFTGHDPLRYHLKTSKEWATMSATTWPPETDAN